MLQVTLDPSLIAINSTDTEAKADIAVTISGISWKDGEAFPQKSQPVTGPDVDEIKKFIYPWKWSGEEPPLKFKLYWVLSNNPPVPNNMLLTVDPPVAQILENFNTDLNNLKSYYDALYDKRLFPGDSVSNLDLYWNYQTSNRQDIVFSDTDYPNEDSGNKLNTGFFISAISICGQELPPLNQLCNLVYFCKDQTITIPGNTKGFLLFPDDDNRWKPMQQNGDFIHPMDDLYYVEYANYNSIPTRVYCPVTPLPTKVSGAENPIQLRKGGNFLGHVDLQAKDIEDQMPSIIYTAGHSFNLPHWFYNFLEKKKEVLYFDNNVLSPADYKKWIQQLNDFLWCTLRDNLGFGYFPESDGNSLFTRVIRAYCDMDGEVNTLSQEDQISYWKNFHEISEKLIKSVYNENLSYSSFSELENPGLNKWKDLVSNKLFNNEQILYSEGYEVLPPKLESRLQSTLQNLEPTEVTEGFKISIDDWLHKWSEFLIELESNALLQTRVVFTQWYSLDLKTAGMDMEKKLGGFKSQEDRFIKTLTWFEKVFSNASEIKELQKEGISVFYQDKILESLKADLDSTSNKITNDILEAVKEYANQRIGTAKPEEKTFYPVSTDPFSLQVQTPLTWFDFLSSILDEDGKIDTAVKKEINITFSIPPNIQLKVDKLEDTPIGEDDLNDEIAGHIVLTRRADALNLNNEKKNFSNNPWRYLNWAKVQGVIINEPKPYDFTNSYISPVFLPETDGNKNSFLQLSNEKLSLVAGHETNNDEPNDGEPPLGYLKYIFDEAHVAYAFWYGYWYNFAGFVALNSGVLPRAIRKDDMWNIPNPDPKLDETDETKPLIKGYHHLRRVPVSKVRIEAKRSDGKTDVLPTPKGLLPLAFELSEWKTNLLSNPSLTADEIQAIKQNEQIHYLLADGVKNEFSQNEIQLTLRKPTTSFWNWYAWIGQESTTKINTVKKTVAQIALERDIKMRDRSAVNNKEVKEHLIDTATENVFIVSIEKLFPVKEAEVQWGVISINDSDYGLDDFASVLKAKIDVTKQMVIKKQN